jgi:hypothetical protein
LLGYRGGKAFWEDALGEWWERHVLARRERRGFDVAPLKEKPSQDESRDK